MFALAGFNAVGTSTPVMVIFKGKHVKGDWICGSPDQAVFRATENGWINSQLFVDWGQRFTAQRRRTTGYMSSCSLKVFELMRQNIIHINSFPPHARPAFLPADKYLFKSLEAPLAEEEAGSCANACKNKKTQEMLFQDNKVGVVEDIILVVLLHP